MSGIAEPAGQFTFLSLFSGAGIGDFGLKLAGGVCLGACELDRHRRAVHAANIHAKHLWADVRSSVNSIIRTLKASPPDVIVATPPCQSFSTANARRGKRTDVAHATRDSRNGLFFEALAVIKRLRPKVVIFENVPNFLERVVSDGLNIDTVQGFMDKQLKGYLPVRHIMCFSALGLPQRRKRAIAIYIRSDLKGSEQLVDQLKSINRWSGKTSRNPKTVLGALAGLAPLDGLSEQHARLLDDPLHSVPTYAPIHYQWIKNIRPGSGESAWENACDSCGARPSSNREVVCWKCGSHVISRPHVIEGGELRAIRGYKTSYRRMRPDDIAPTITTASGHFSSDLKLHPTQNRVLSARECAILQGIPFTFNWPEEQRFKSNYLIREMIGEAVPPLITYRLGKTLALALKEE